MVALPANQDLLFTDVMRWASEQARYLDGPTDAAMLYYLTACMFNTEDNEEGAPRGQVLFGCSSYSAIMRGTGIKSENTVRATLNRLQDKAYVVRSRRRGAGHQPLKIQVLYDETCDMHREKIRAGQEDLPAALLIRPVAPKRNAQVIPLRAVEVATE